GVMLKNVHAPYVKVSVGEREHRSKDTWIKVKRYDTYDVVIMGFTKPTKEYTGKHPGTWPYIEDGVLVTRDYHNDWIGAVRFGQYNDQWKLVEIGQTNGMSDEDKKFFTENQDQLLRTVMEVGAMSQSKKTGALRHPRFIRLRPDKLA